MTQQQAARHGPAIDIPKTIAGVLAAVSAAVVGSYLGVAGTLIGAAVASVVGSVGTELYQRWIHKGSHKLRTTFVTAPAAVGTPEVAAAAEEVPSQPEPVAPTKIRWGRVSAVAAAVFVLAVGTLTAFELVTGKSAADAVGNRSSSTTTLCSVLCANKSKPTPASSPSPRPSATSTSGTPSPTATTSVPAATSAATPTPTATTGTTTGTTTSPNPAGQAPTTPAAPQNHIAPPNEVVPQRTE
jgi:hypothetical protein